MAASLNWLADVATEGDTPNLLRVQIVVRREVATVSRNGTVLAEKADVVAVEQPQTRQALIRFADGSAWAAIIPGPGRPGCGCT